MLAFDDLSEQALRAVVLDIVAPETRTQIEAELHPTLSEIENLAKTKRTKRNVEYVPRGPTGRMAEEFFVSSFLAGSTPFEGTLEDQRDHGVGFDFAIIRTASRSLVEIKGLAKQTGGVTFTDKEWKVAIEAQGDYFLGLVTQVFDSPKIGFVQNPAQHLTPAYHAYTTVTVNWAVSANQLASVERY